MTTKKYTVMTFALEVELIGHIDEKNEQELASLYYDINKRLENWVMAFNPKTPGLAVNSLGKLHDYEGHYQMED